MGCSSCSTGKDGQPKGCKNNGTCGTDGCNKLTVFDWLSNMSLPNGEKPFDCVEVRFKNSRKEFFRNSENLSLSIGDIVATQAQSGHDIGMVTLTGELVKVQMKKKKEDYTSTELPNVYRKASQKDIDIWQRCRDREAEIQKRSRELAIALNLQMKLSDVEFQGDGSKATFYYTAEERVDFRQLIKDMAKSFGIRIEMRQIALKDFPSQETKILTEKGVAICQKVDIFKATLWFCYKDDWANWHAVSKDQVNEMLEKNKRKEKVSSLEEYAIVPSEEIEKEKVFENVVGQDSLTRFDRPKQSKNNRNKKKPNNNPNANNNKKPNPNKKTGNSNNPQTSSDTNQNNKRRNNRKRPAKNG